MTDVIIIGGGLAGLIASIRLSRAGIKCVLVEKKHYPVHRVCGEYISNEVVPFLRSENLYPEFASPSRINSLMLSSVRGDSVILPLDLGGFGISRYTFDTFLYEEAKKSGVQFILGTTAENVELLGQTFRVKTSAGEFISQVVIGAFGKRSTLDTKLDRAFIRKRSPFLGVKYHMKGDHIADQIALHNFNGGYCGVIKVENDIVNVCYLIQSELLRSNKTIKSMEEKVLHQNPFLKKVFTSYASLHEKPETINEISFETKEPIEHHLLMAGDAAGMITPLCGNGMAMAIRSGKIVSDHVLKFFTDRSVTRAKLEEGYRIEWNREFKNRLWAGRQIQRLFGTTHASAAAVHLAQSFPAIAATLVRRTHGKPF